MGDSGSLQQSVYRISISSLDDHKDTVRTCWENLDQQIINTTSTTVLQPFFRDHPGEPVPEEKCCTLWCKGRLTEADTPTIRLGATPSGLTSAHLHHSPLFTGRMPFQPLNQQCQSSERLILVFIGPTDHRHLLISAVTD